MKRIAIAALMVSLLICASQAHASACIGPAAPHLARLMASGLLTETVDGDVMDRALTELRQRVPFDEQPSYIVLVFGENRAAVWLIEGDQLCNVIYGPADGLREILRKAKGDPA